MEMKEEARVRYKTNPVIAKMQDELEELYKDYAPIVEGSWGVGDMDVELEEWIEYVRTVVESEGFEADYIPDATDIIQPIPLYTCCEKELHILNTLMTKAVDHYNANIKEGTNKINDPNPELVKVTGLSTGFFRYFITFQAKDDAGELNLYRARAEQDPVLADSEITFCRFFKKAVA